MDGSGILYDPSGIDRTELKRLAQRRLPVSNFNRSMVKRLGPKKNGKAVFPQLFLVFNKHSNKRLLGWAFRCLSHSLFFCVDLLGVFLFF